MNKALMALLLALGAFALTGCTDDDCETGVSGCDSGWYSCPQAAKCYSTSSGCSASGECD